MTAQRTIQQTRYSETVPRNNQFHTIRRLDWRFLLPDPRLNRVIYFGPENDPLAAALKQFADFFQDGSCNGRREDPCDFDVAVLKTEKPLILERVHTVLKTGGYLYCEIDSGQDGFPGITKQIERLKNAGFAKVWVYWHRPNFENCLDIVPLGEKQAIDHFFGQKRTDVKGRVKTAAGRLLSALGMLRLMISNLSFVACKS
ncbi:MAG: hypothetical protein ACE5IR_08665 [bacterium]